jgi:hypothetical protein
LIFFDPVADHAAVEEDMMKTVRAPWMGAFLGLAFVAVGCAPAREQPGEAARSALTDPTVLTPEVGFEGQPAASYGRESYVNMATGDGVHLVVWGGASVGAIRVRASDNTPLDSVSFRLVEIGDPCNSSGLRPGVGFTAGTFLVTWRGTNALCYTRVKPDGTVLDRPARVLSSVADVRASAVSGDGTNFLVAWGDVRNALEPLTNPEPGLDIYGARIRASDGVSLDGSGFPIVTEPLRQFFPAVAFDGTNYLVVWGHGEAPGGVIGTRIRASDREILDPAGIRLGPGARPAVAFGGGNFMVIGAHFDKIWRMRVRPSDGAVLDGFAAGLVAISGLGILQYGEPAVASDGTNFMAAWRGRSREDPSPARIRVLPFLGDGTPVGTPTVLEPNPGQNDPWQDNAIVAGEGKYLVAWNRYLGVQDPLGSSWYDVNGASVDGATGTVLRPSTALSQSLPHQDKADASFDGRHHLLVWSEFTGQLLQLRAARVRDSDGELLDANGLAIAGPAADNQVRPRAVSNGRNHLVVWQEGRRLRALYVRAEDGTALAPPVDLPPESGQTSVGSAHFGLASDGRDYMITWASTPFAPTPSLVGVRFDGDGGGLLDPSPRTIRGPSNRLRFPSLGYLAPHYVATWSEAQTTNPADHLSNVYFQRLVPDGTPVGTPTRLAEGVFQGESAVVAMEGQAALLWLGSGGVMAARMRAGDGVVLDAAPGLTLTDSVSGGGHVENINAAYDGEHLLVGWLRWDGRRVDMRLSRMTPSGAVLDRDGLVLVGGSDGFPLMPALSASPGGRTLLAYQRHLGPPASDWRLRVRWLGRATLPPDAGPPDAGQPDVAPDATPAPDAAPIADATPAPAPDADARPDVRRDGGGAGGDDDPINCSCDLGGPAGGAPGKGAVVVLGLGLAIARRRWRRRGR